MKLLFTFLISFLITLSCFPETKTLVCDTPEIIICGWPYQNAEFPKGQAKLMEFISTNIKYHTYVQEKEIEGKVYIKFDIEVNGKVSNVKVLKGVHALLDSEAVRVIKLLPDWIPAKDNGKPIKSSFNIPLSFRLSENSGIANKTDYAGNFELNKNDSNLNKTTLLDISAYLLSKGNLKLEKDNAFVSDYRMKTNFKPDIGSFDIAAVHLIFNTTGIVLSKKAFMDSIEFKSLPISENVTILALKKIGNLIYVAKLDTLINNKEPPILAFNPISMELLKKLRQEIGIK